MRITVDTNILVRIVVRDDVSQADRALELLEAAETVVIPLPCLCEFAWVLLATYAIPPTKVARSIRMVCDRANVSVDDAAVAAGLVLLEAGGDFADGAIALAGASMGGETFVSFDRKAVSLLARSGIDARLVDAIR